MSMDRAHGLEGSNVLNDTSLITGKWFAVYVIADAVLNTGTTVCSGMTGLANLNGVTLSAGTTIYGNFTSIQLVSGLVIAYQADQP